MRRLTVLCTAAMAIAAAAPAVAQAPAVTLSIGKVGSGPLGTVTTVRYGELVRLTGDINEARGGETVEVTIAPYRGETTIRQAVTEADGEFRFTHRPTIRTSYTARWRGAASAQEPYAYVTPKLALRVVNARLGRFVVTMQARREHASRVVWFQRRINRTQWRTVKRVRFPSGRLSARFTARLPRGLHRVRVFVPQTPGYLRATSPFVLARGY